MSTKVYAELVRRFKHQPAISFNNGRINNGRGCLDGIYILANERKLERGIRGRRVEEWCRQG